MMPTESKLREYEGLIRSTAARYAPILDEHDFEDVQQVLRLKVWRALAAYDSTRSSQSEKGFVFSCVTNQVKDLLKSSSRRHEARGGRQHYIEDERETDKGFDGRYLCEDDEQAYMAVLESGEAVLLPSTLTPLERRVVALLLLDLNQTEIALTLRVTRTKVRLAHAEVKVKMADWRPAVAEELVAA